jgi:hypothetical protein
MNTLLLGSLVCFGEGHPDETLGVYSENLHIGARIVGVTTDGEHLVEERRLCGGEWGREWRWPLLPVYAPGTPSTRLSRLLVMKEFGPWPIQDDPVTAGDFLILMLVQEASLLEFRMGGIELAFHEGQLTMSSEQKVFT